MSKSLSKNAVFKTMLILFNIALPLIITPIVLGAIKETYNGYISAVPILMVFSIYLITTGIDRIIEQQIIYVFGYEKIDTRLALYGGIVNLILNYALVFFGIFTPAMAVVTTLIANIFLISLEYNYLVKRVIKLDIKLFSISNIKYLLYSLIFIPICMVINSNIENILISCAADVICCGAVYLGILLVTRDKTFQELYSLLLKKAYSRINN